MATLNIAIDATVGQRTVAVQTGAEQISLNNGFTVQPGIPVITSINPASGQPGQTLPGAVITGAFTHFTQAASMVTFSNPGVTANNVQVMDNTHLTATLMIAPTATSGASDVTVMTGSETAIGMGLFTVGSTPAITSVNPNMGQQGQTLLGVAITGSLTHFTQAPPLVTFSNPGVTASNVQVTDNTHLTVTMTISATAAVGASNVTVVTGTEAATGLGLFTVAAGPTITQVNPNTGLQGQQNLPVAVTGSFTHFVQNTTTASFGAGITINSVTVMDPTHATVNISLATSAALGGRTVTMTTGMEVATLGNGFAVTTIAGPTITDFNPKTASIGTLVTITGTNLQPNPGTSAQVTLAKQGTGTITVPTSTVSPTSITFVVPTGAATGPLTVTVNNHSATTTTPLTIVPASSFTLTAAPGSANLIRGQSTAYAINLTSINGFDQLVALSVTGLPQGVTSAFQPQKITGGQTSILTLNAPASQPAGTATLTLSGTVTIDGIPVVQSATVTLNVTPITTSFLGRTVVSDALETPLATVAVTMLGKDGNGNTTGCTGNTVSDGAGNFLLTNLPAMCVGPQLVGFDGTTVTNPPGKYAGVNLVYTFVAAQVTVSPVLVHLPRIDNQETFLVQQNTAANQSYSFSSIPGLTVTVYAHTTFTMPDNTQPNPFPLTAIQVPVDRLPDAKPQAPTMMRAFIVAFQPANATANQPVAVYFPNTLNTPPGSNMSLMTLDPTRGQMVPYGTGTVSSDATQIVPYADAAHPGHLYGLVHFDWHGPMPAPPNQSNPGPPGGGAGSGTGGGAASGPGSGPGNGTGPGGGNGGNNGGGDSGGNGGNNGDNGGDNSGDNGGGGGDCLHAANRLPDFLTTEGPAQAGDPVDLFSGIQVITNTDIAIRGSRGSISVVRTYRSLTAVGGPFGIGTNHNYNYGLDTALPNSVNNINLIMPDGNRFPFSKSGSTFTNSTVPTFRGAVMTVNSDSSVDLRWKTGTVYHFVPINFQIGSLLVSIRDSNGNTIVITRDASGKVTTVADPVGRMLMFSYDGSNRILSITDPIGRSVQYTYNTQGTLATVTDPVGGTTRYDYDARNNMTKVTDPRMIVQAQNTLDAVGRVTQQLRPDGGVLTFAYTPINPDSPVSQMLQARVTDNNGVQATYRFNVNGFVTDVTATEGQTRHIERADGTNLLKSFVEFSSIRRFSYDDANGDLLSSTDATGHTTQFTYDSVFNKVTSITDALGNVSRFTYDTRGNVLTSTDANGNMSSYQYDPTGLLLQSTDALGQKTKFAYDGFGNLITVTDPLGNTTSYLYDGISRLVATMDSLGRQTSFTYDALGRLLTRTDAKNGLTQFTYDPDGNLTSVKDAKNNTTTFTYDSMNRLVSRIDALHRADTRTYDTNGSLIQFIDRRGQTSTFAYDNLNRLVGETYQDAAVTRTYDVLGRLAQVDDSAVGTFTFSYDLAGRLTASSTPVGTVNYTYDRRGAMISRQVAGQAALSYAYDRAGNLTSSTLPTASASFAYNARNQLSNLDRLNGVSSVFTYDPDARLITLTHAKGGPIDIESYVYDAVGNRTAHSTSIGQSLITQSVVNQFNAVNELIQFGTAANAYDANGNLVQEGTTTTYTWDSRNRLKSIVTAGQTTSFTYDFAGNLIAQADSGTLNLTRSFVLDDQTNMAFETATDGTSYSVLSGRSIDSHLSIIQSDGQVQYGLPDAVNSTVATVDQTGAVKSRFLYEPYGSTTMAGAYPFQFTGRVPVSAAVYNYRARFYSTATGRFISEDPIGFVGGPNMYTYALNNPVGFRDPLGLAPKCLKWIILAGQLACEIWGIDVKQDPIPDPTPVGITQPAPPTGGTGGKGPPDDEPIPIPSPSFCPTPVGPPILSPFPIGRPIRGPIFSPFPGGSPIGFGLHP